MLYERTGSLYPCIGLHCVNNSVAFSSTQDWTWQIPVYFWIGGIGAGVHLFSTVAQLLGHEDRALIRTSRYTVLIKANECDFGWVKQESGVEASSRTTFVIQDKTGGKLTNPKACQ